MRTIANIFAWVCGFVAGVLPGRGSRLTRADLKRLERFHSPVGTWPEVEEDLFEPGTFAETAETTTAR